MNELVTENNALGLGSKIRNAHNPGGHSTKYDNVDNKLHNNRLLIENQQR